MKKNFLLRKKKLQKKILWLPGKWLWMKKIFFHPQELTILNPIQNKVLKERWKHDESRFLWQSTVINWVWNESGGVFLGKRRKTTLDSISSSSSPEQDDKHHKHSTWWTFNDNQSDEMMIEKYPQEHDKWMKLISRYFF